MPSPRNKKGRPYSVRCLSSLLSDFSKDSQSVVSQKAPAERMGQILATSVTRTVTEPPTKDPSIYDAIVKKHPTTAVVPLRQLSKVCHRSLHAKVAKNTPKRYRGGVRQVRHTTTNKTSPATSQSFLTPCSHQGNFFPFPEGFIQRP